MRMTSSFESRWRKRRRVSRPVRPPMRTSMMTRSGLSFGMIRRPSSPLDAVVSSMSGESKIRWNEYCTSASSSISSNLLMWPAPLLGGEYSRSEELQQRIPQPAHSTLCQQPLGWWLRLDKHTDMKSATLKFLVPTILGALSCTDFARAAAAPLVPAKPNIVFILADDIGYGDFSCYGAIKVKTPNIDRLASRGVRFTDDHSTAAVCTPSRYALMTGQYAWRNPAGDHIL